MAARESQSDLVLDHLRVGALGVHLGPFATALAEQGFSRGVIRYAVRLASQLGLWLDRRGRGAESVAEQDLVAFLRARWRRRRRHRSDRSVLKHLLVSLRDYGVAPQRRPAVPEGWVDHALIAFSTYLKHERALAEATVANYRSLIEEFLHSPSAHERASAGALRPADVHRFLLQYAKRGVVAGP